MYKRNNQGWLKHIDFILWDVAALQLAFISASIIRWGVVHPYGMKIYRTLGLIYVIADIIVAASFNTMHNVMKRGYLIEAVESIKQVLLVFGFVMLYMFATQSGDTYSRIALFITAGLHFVIGYVIRQLWKLIVRRKGKTGRNASMLIVADEENIAEILGKAAPIDSMEYTGIVLINRNGTGEEIDGIPIVADLENASDYICREWVDEVFIYPSKLMDTGKQDTEQNKTVDDLIEDCGQMAIPIHIRVPVSTVRGKNFMEKIGGYAVLTTAVNYASPLQLALKRIIDIIGGLVGSIVALAIIAMVGPKIKKESPGPILFKQTRIGLNGKKFKIYKIRTMYMDAEERKAELMKENRVQDGMMFKLDFDPRIIGNKVVDGKRECGIGEWLRAGSWDEWPQFFNVLIGQMSLVGTRPPTVDEWEKYKYHHRARLAIKPGITGMWQVSGRSRITDFEEVVKLDTEYINNWSLGLDIRILLKTVKAVLTKDGAM